MSVYREEERKVERYDDWTDKWKRFKRNTGVSGEGDKGNKDYITDKETSHWILIDITQV